MRACTDRGIPDVESGSTFPFVGTWAGAGGGAVFSTLTFDVTYVFPTLRSHKSARAAVLVTTYGRRPRRSGRHSTLRGGPARLSDTCLQWALLLV